MTKATRELKERCVGYHITEHGMWNSAVCCKTLPLHALQNDAMHAYFANGIVSSEVTLLLSEVQRVTKKGPEEVLEAVLRAKWQRAGPAKRNGENASWLKKDVHTSLFPRKHVQGIRETNAGFGCFAPVALRKRLDQESGAGCGRNQLLEAGEMHGILAPHCATQKLS